MRALHEPRPAVVVGLHRFAADVELVLLLGAVW